jgi:hypothetical protein
MNHSGRPFDVSGGLLADGSVLLAPCRSSFAADQGPPANSHDRRAKPQRPQLVKEALRNGVPLAEGADRKRAVVVGIIIVVVVIIVWRPARLLAATAAAAVLILGVGVGDELPASAGFDDRIGRTVWPRAARLLHG